MSYNPNIPQTTDSTLQSFNQLRANFQQINNSFATNHVGLTQDASIAGMHSALTLRPQAADPTTSATEIGIYNKLVSGIPNLFFAPNSAQTPIQMSYPSIKADYSVTQYTFVAGPFIIYAGRVNGLTNASQGQTVTLTPGSQLIYVDLTMLNAKISGLNQKMATPTNVSGTSFNISFQSFVTGTFDIFYFAIGLP
jgi:hypothetical protein